ncbi:MAG: betaine-aldehyde dehydrogenase [Roseinatronobacter sp.]
MKAQPRASHFVAGEWLDDTAGAAFESRYPATGDVIAKLHAATPEVINSALTAARDAQLDWAGRPPVERGRILRRAADLLRARNHDLSILETLDTGKPLQETLVADAASAADALEYFAGFAATVTGQTIPLGRDMAYTMREPHGVCVGIGAWNYPIQIAAWKAAPALAFGNAMVFKPSEETPLSALALAEVLHEAGLPAGLFNVVQGLGETGAALCSDPRVAKVSLTGSVPTGRSVYAAAGAGLKAVTMELGGKSPLIIFDDADLDNAVGAAMLANFYSSGQICSNGTRVFVQRSVKDAFLDKLVIRTSRIILGDPLDQATQMGPLISASHMDKVLSYVDAGQAEGARLVCGGARHGDTGNFVQPTVFADVSDSMKIAREEIFGPVMSVLDFEDEADVIARANATEYGLAAGVFTANLTRAHTVVAKLHAGTCWINAYNLTPVEMPFGGVKASGVGRENGHAALEYYTRVKSVYLGLGDVDVPY